MQTHYDDQHNFRRQFLEQLTQRAEAAKEAKASAITGGYDDDEPELGKWKASNGVHCRQLPNDPQDILRISIGGGDHLPVTMNYVVVRGGIGQCIALLEKSIAALRECPE